MQPQHYCPDGYLLTSLSPRSTNLPVAVHAQLACADGCPHGMTLLVSATPALSLEEDRYAVVAIGNDPVRVVGGCDLPFGAIEQVGFWVRLNRAALHAHWSGRLDSIQMTRRLRPLGV